MLLSLEKKEKTYLLIFIIGLVSMLFFRDVVGIGINKYIILAFCAVLMFASKCETIIYMLCFLIPLFNGLPGTYILLVAVVLLLVKQKKFSKKIVLLTSCFVILEFFDSLWYTSSNYIELAQYFFFIFVFFILLYDDSEKDDFLCIELYYIAVFVFAFIVIVSGIKSAPSNWMSLFAKGWFRFGETNADGSSGMMLRGNANELAYYCVSGVGVGLFLVSNSKNFSNRNRLLMVSMLVWIGISGFLSLSRSYVIVVTFLVMLFAISQTRSVKNTVVFVFISAVIGFGAIKYLSQNGDILNGFITRFNDSTMATGNGRTTGLALQWSAFFDNPRCLFTGTGVTQYSDILHTSSIHNMFSQVVICYGFVFSFVFFISMLKPISIKRKYFFRIDRWLPFLAVIIFVQTIQFVNPYVLMLPYAIAVYCLNYSKEK